MIINRSVFVLMTFICCSLISGCKSINQDESDNKITNQIDSVDRSSLEKKEDKPLCWEVPEENQWSGSTTVVDVDGPGLNVGKNLSGLAWQPSIDDDTAVLWAVVNGPSELHRLVLNEDLFVESVGYPKTMLYTDGKGSPDSEGITVPNYQEPFVFVASERNDTKSTKKISRLSVLRYDTNHTDKDLRATHEWDLTSDIENANTVVAANKGFEAITFLPDDYLLASGFINQITKQLYSKPEKEHNGGVFIMGMEKTGQLFAYILFLDGSFEHIATIDSKLKKIVSLEFDRSSEILWAGCDNKCENKFSLLEINDAGKIVFTHFIKPPAGLNIDDNNEGFAIVDDSLTVNGIKSVIWAEDDGGNGQSLHRGKLKTGRPCH